MQSANCKSFVKNCVVEHSNKPWMIVGDSIMLYQKKQIPRNRIKIITKIYVCYIYKYGSKNHQENTFVKFKVQ